MTAPDLETRLRGGLRAAAEALPPAAADEAGPAAVPNHGDGPDGLVLGRLERPAPRSRRTATAVAVAAATTLVVVGAAVALTGGDGDGADVESVPATEPTATPSTTAPGTTTPTIEGVEGPAVDPAAGTAVVVDAELVTFGPDGQQEGRLSLAPLESVQTVVSDRHGAWIACGSPPYEPPEVPVEDGDTFTLSTETPEAWAGTTTTAPVTPPTQAAGDAAGDAATDAAVAEREDQVEAIQIQVGEEATRRAEAEAESGDATSQPTSNIYRYRPGHDPEPLGFNVTCVASSLGVTEIDGHDSLVFVSPGDFTLQRYDLVTGDRAALGIDALSLSPGGGSVGGGRLATFGQDGLVVRDLTSGEVVPVAPLDLPNRPPEATSGAFTDEITLSPTGDTLAALVGEMEDLDLVVYDLATGTELLRRPVTSAAEGSEIAYDGTSVAVGNFYDMYGPIQVFDVATGAERTVDAYGLLP